MHIFSLAASAVLGASPVPTPAATVNKPAAVAAPTPADSDPTPAATDPGEIAALPSSSGASGASGASGDSHSLELYGFAQFDAIQDFDRVNPDWEAALRPSRIPTVKGQYGSDGQSILSIRQSRLGAKASGELAGHSYEAKVEFDFFGVGADAGKVTPRLRHAYGRWGPILAGQTNSLFMDGDIFPN